MADGHTTDGALDSVGVNVFSIEHTTTIKTNEFRKAVRVTDFTSLSIMKSLFSSIKLKRLTCEARQNSLISDDGPLTAAGHIFLAVIPTAKNTDAHTGTNTANVTSVPHKQTFPLAASVQSNGLFEFNLAGYELDLAADPRRGAGPVVWIGNSGVLTNGDGKHPIVCTVTWRAEIECSGTTPLWV